MFSLTTAVRIESMAHSLIMTKIMKTSFEGAQASKSGSSTDLCPSMTMKSTKMLSGTLRKISITSFGESPPKSNPSLKTFTASSEKKYRTTIVSSSTQTMPAIACAMPARSTKSCGTFLMSLTSRKMRSSLAVRSNMTSGPILLEYDALWPAMKPCTSENRGSIHWSAAPPTTMMKSIQFQAHSCGSYQNLRPQCFIRARSSNMKTTSTACSQ
mmetsp:Transcript_52445/g.149481  ORF Transcript_52445/g.149481 Transcript_52445/m.149481 type:complete len:213 (+) Transcript_52445:933-1571(+)